MITVTTALLASGPDFSPRRAEEAGGFVFTSQHERGLRMERGRYKGDDVPYGSGDLTIENFDPARPNPGDLKQLEHVVRCSRAAGATDLALHLDVAFVGQCNFEFSPELLAALGTLSLPLTVTCSERAP